MMKQDIKDKEFRGNREYVSPSVKVIEVTAQRVLCVSNEKYNDGDTSGWYNN